jgi:hypothetical protein
VITDPDLIEIWRFVRGDGVNSWSLRTTVEDLARVRRGIRVSELARLLNLDPETASALARGAIETKGVAIELDLD